MSTKEIIKKAKMFVNYDEGYWSVSDGEVYQDNELVAFCNGTKVVRAD